MYCFDTSALAALVLEEEPLESYLEEQVITLNHAFVETLNVIWKRVVLLGEVERFDEPLRRLEILRELLVVKDTWNYRDLVLDISSTYKLPVYDTLFIACSLREGAKLVTLDTKQKRVYKELSKKRHS